MKNQFLEITDPIHDFIRLNSTEQKIIDTSVFQRLRRIKQLSGAHLTYPGAQHTRFEHSLGVMHIAGMAATSLASKKQMPGTDIDDIRLAALLHDIGHGPFSHLFEEVLQKKKRITHEQIGKEIILKSEIGDIISKTTDKKKINRLAVGEGSKQFENEIISGALSADMMDYLLRDGYFTGAEHAKIDHNRITNSFEVYKNKLALQSSALVNFETMMISRFQMFKAVYFHKTVRAGEVMLLEAMSLADDHLDRKLFKCVFEKTISGKKTFGKNTLKQFRADIAKKSKLAENQIFIDTTTTHSMPLAPSKKESSSIILIKKEGGKITPQIIPISKIPLVSTMSGKMNILRAYTQQKNRNKVEIAAKSILGEL